MKKNLRKLPVFILITILAILVFATYSSVFAVVDKTYNSSYSKERLEGDKLCTYYYSNKDVLKSVNCIPAN